MTSVVYSYEYRGPNDDERFPSANLSVLGTLLSPRPLGRSYERRTFPFPMNGTNERSLLQKVRMVPLRVASFPSS